MSDADVAILGRWTHSFEEDHDGVTVYRREDYPFPPARGRRGVEFGSDGTLVEWQIGRGDVPAPRTGDRHADGSVTFADGRTADCQVVDLRPDRLELKWTRE